MTSSQNASKKPKRKHGAAGSTVKYYPPPNGLFWRRWLANNRQSRPRNSRATRSRLASFVQPRQRRAPKRAPKSNRNKQTTSNRDNGAQHGALVLTKPASTQHGALVATAQKRGGVVQINPPHKFIFIHFIYQQSKTLLL